MALSITNKMIFWQTVDSTCIDIQKVIYIDEDFPFSNNIYTKFAFLSSFKGVLIIIPFSSCLSLNAQ